jgi:hypothetical protein
MLFLSRMQSAFRYTIRSIDASILYACARELNLIGWNSQKGLGIESKPNFIAGFIEGSGFTLGSICRARDVDNRKI